MNKFFPFNLEGTVHIIEDINVNIPELAKRLLLICGQTKIVNKKFTPHCQTMYNNLLAIVWDEF